MSRSRTVALAMLVSLALALWRLCSGDPVTDALEARLYDLRLLLRGGAGSSGAVALVVVDEAALVRIGTGAPMRRALADAVARLHAEGVSAVAIDLLLLGPTAADATLAEALRAGPSLLAMAAVTDGAAEPAGPGLREVLARSAFRVVTDRSGGTAPPPPPLALPGPTLAEAAEGLAHANLVRDPDRIARRIPLALDVGDGVIVPALPLAAARLALGLPPDALRLDRGSAVLIGGRRIPTGADDTILIEHAGPAGTIDRVALGAFLDGARPAGGLGGRVVVIGATAESLRDVAATPLDPDMPGAETLAAVTAQLIEGRRLDDGPVAALATVVLATAAAGAAALAALAPAVGLAVLATAAVWAAAALLLQAALVWLSLVPDATAVALALAAGSLPGWALGRLAERTHARKLAPHVSPLIDHERGTGTRTAVVAFVDVIGSTGLGETLSADAFAATLGAAQRRIAAAAARHGGLVAEILGDGALVVFGLSATPKDAARSALGFLRELVVNPASLPTRATAHLGPVAIVDLGTGARRHLTVTGDTVNVAARLLDAARGRDVPVLVSAALLDAAGGAPDAHPLGRAALRGRRKTLAVFGLTGCAPSAG